MSDTETQSTEHGHGHHIFQIPVDGYFNLYHSDEPYDDEKVKELLDQHNTGGGMLVESVPNPAKIEVKIDDEEAVVWFTPDPGLPLNERARTMIADLFGWHMVYWGSVCIDGLSADRVHALIEQYG